MKRERECGAGCGSKLRRGHARGAYVLTSSGALHRTLVCPLCARRGVLTVAHLDEPLRERPPVRVKPRAASRFVGDWLEPPPAQSVGTMSREALEDEALELGPPDKDHVRRDGIRAMSREQLEAWVAVERARTASSSGTEAAPCSVPGCVYKHGDHQHHHIEAP